MVRICKISQEVQSLTVMFECCKNLTVYNFPTLTMVYKALLSSVQKIRVWFGKKIIILAAITRYFGKLIILDQSQYVVKIAMVSSVEMRPQIRTLITFMVCFLDAILNIHKKQREICVFYTHLYIVLEYTLSFSWNSLQRGLIVQKMYDLLFSRFPDLTLYKKVFKWNFSTWS